MSERARVNEGPGGPQRRRERKQLSDEAADYVRELIMSGQLLPGAYIRQEQIADELGMSATPVREGLLALRGEGLVLLLPRRGFLVDELSSDDIRDLFVSQALIAGELAARAAGILDDDDLDKLEQLQTELDAASRAGDVDEMERLNHEFHRRINTASGSDKLSWFLRMAARNVPRRFYAVIGGWRDASLHEHSAILAALRGRDAEGARLAVEAHVRHAGQLLAEHFEQEQGGHGPVE